MFKKRCDYVHVQKLLAIIKLNSQLNCWVRVVARENTLHDRVMVPWSLPLKIENSHQFKIMDLISLCN